MDIIIKNLSNHEIGLLCSALDLQVKQEREKASRYDSPAGFTIAYCMRILRDKVKKYKII